MDGATIALAVIIKSIPKPPTGVNPNICCRSTNAPGPTRNWATPAIGIHVDDTTGFWLSGVVAL